MTRLLLISLLLLACASTGPPIEYTTIRVVNQSTDALRIYDDRGMRVGSVGPGQSVCIVIRHGRDTVLVADAVGGAAVQSLPMSTHGMSWEWTIRMLNSIDSIATAPADRCT